MDLSHPMTTAIPSSHGDVLEVLAHTDVALSARAIAALTNGRVSHTQVGNALRHLVSVGLVFRESHPPANLYQLNRDHVAADPVVAMASLRAALLGRMRSSVATWDPHADAVWLFGSFARGEGSADSDIDVLVLVPPSVDDDDPTWMNQLDKFSSDVQMWSGNSCRIVEYRRSEFDDLTDEGERLPRDIARDGIRLAGSDIPRVAIRRARK
ncbi:MAG: nucleotidyltransferase domain-containing protein [Acidimicrobiia bacterium]